MSIYITHDPIFMIPILYKNKLITIFQMNVETKIGQKMSLSLYAENTLVLLLVSTSN